MTKNRHGGAFVGVGAFLIALCVLLFLLVYFGILTNTTWWFSWITTYGVSACGVVLGIVLLACGAYIGSTLAKFEQRIAELEEAKTSEEKNHMTKVAALEGKKRLEMRKRQAKEMELDRIKADAEIKEISLRLSRSQLKKARLKAKKKERAMRKLGGKLEERSKQLKRIREIAKSR